MNPSIPRKFALGLIQVALGFYILVLAIANFQNAAGLVPWIFLAFCYLLHTTGELCLSPIGLSMVTKLAAEKETGLAMGGWFLSIAMAQYMAGLIAAIASGGGHGPEAGAAISQYSDTYMMLFLVGLGFGVASLVAAPLINKLSAWRQVKSPHAAGRSPCSSLVCLGVANPRTHRGRPGNRRR